MRGGNLHRQGWATWVAGDGQVNKRWLNSLCQRSALNPERSEDVRETDGPESCEATDAGKQEERMKQGEDVTIAMTSFRRYHR